VFFGIGLRDRLSYGGVGGGAAGVVAFESIVDITGRTNIVRAVVAEKNIDEVHDDLPLDSCSTPSGRSQSLGTPFTSLKPSRHTKGKYENASRMVEEGWLKSKGHRERGYECRLENFREERLRPIRMAPPSGHAVDHFAGTLNLLEEAAIIAGFQQQMRFDHRINWRGKRRKAS